MDIRLPDIVSVYTEESRFDFSASEFSQGDVFCGLELDNGILNVSLRGDKTPLRHLRLRWSFTCGEKRTDRVRIYGDAWERAGGDLEWRGIVPERCMPWFCLVSNGTDLDRDTSERFTEGFGVKVRPGAMCFWQYDSAGVTLWLDVRSGGAGVILGGRTLLASEVVFGNYRGCSAFSAGQSFCKMMSPSPKELKTKVYGSNNW